MGKLKDSLNKLELILSHKELRLRKWTTPIHWAFGFFCDYLIFSFGILAGWGMMGMFAGFEAWNDKCDGGRQGAKDWWEAFLMFCIGKIPLAILHCLGIITIRWF